jgi:APA family basic amino acid/polyamine antiporter
VKDPGRTIPRALIAGMATVAIVYLAATLGVMALVPSATLAASAAPFADAARVLGPLGAPLVAIAALLTLMGTLNGVLFCCGQMPMALARDGLAPAAFASVNAGGTPAAALLASAVLGSILLITNYTRGLVGAYALLVSMSTLLVLFVYAFCAAAEIRRSKRAATGWALLAFAAVGFALFASFGSGLEALWQGLVLMLAAAPLYLLAQRRQPSPLA